MRRLGLWPDIMRLDRLPGALERAAARRGMELDDMLGDSSTAKPTPALIRLNIENDKGLTLHDLKVPKIWGPRRRKGPSRARP